MLLENKQTHNCVKTVSTYTRFPVLCQKGPIPERLSISLQFSHFPLQELFTFCREGRWGLKPCACTTSGTSSTRVKEAHVTDVSLLTHRDRLLLSLGGHRISPEPAPPVPTASGKTSQQFLHPHPSFWAPRSSSPAQRYSCGTWQAHPGTLASV